MTTPRPSHSPCGPLPPRDFERFRRLAFEFCGLDIGEGKEELVASRLCKVMRSLGIPSYAAYYDYVVNDRTGDALTVMIDRLTTNHTSFFREHQHFEFMASTVFPWLAQREHIDIWSAASSTGEEPYSVAIAAREFFGEFGPAIQILASDISTRVIETARRAVYEQARLRGLPNALLHRYFLRGNGASTGLFRVKPQVRRMVQFQRVNLNENFDGITTAFPLILCRNVMIYFNSGTQQQLVERLYRLLEPGGYLFIGHSESLNRISHSFEYVQPAIYRKPVKAA